MNGPLPPRAGVYAPSRALHLQLGFRCLTVFLWELVVAPVRCGDPVVAGLLASGAAGFIMSIVLF